MINYSDTIMRVVNAYGAAVSAKDVHGFTSLYSPDVRVFDLWGEWSYDGLDAWQQAVAGWFGSLGTERVMVDIEVVRTFETAELAVVEAFVVYKAVTDTGETLRAMRNRLSWVLTPAAGTWLISHEHTSAPADPATMRVIL